MKNRVFLLGMNYELITTKSPFYEQILTLRQLVLRAPLGMNIMDDDLSDEPNQTIAVGIENKLVVACVIAKELPKNRWKLRQMAVAPEYQAQGIGRALMTFMEDTAVSRGIEQIELHARETALNFYLKLGYEVSGERFTEVGIPHWYMWKNVVRTALI